MRLVLCVDAGCAVAVTGARRRAVRRPAVRRDPYGWAQPRVAIMSARRICIVGLDSYGMLSGEENPKYIGGESIQHVLLARAWRDLGHDVSMIVHDEGQGARREHDGITAIAAHYAPRRHSRICASSIRAPRGCCPR